MTQDGNAERGQSPPKVKNDTTVPAQADAPPQEIINNSGETPNFSELMTQEFRIQVAGGN